MSNYGNKTVEAIATNSAFPLLADINAAGLLTCNGGNGGGGDRKLGRRRPVDFTKRLARNLHHAHAPVAKRQTHQGIRIA